MLLGILHVRLFLGEKTVEGLLGIIGGLGQGKTKEGVRQVDPVEYLFTFTLGRDFVAVE